MKKTLLLGFHDPPLRQSALELLEATGFVVTVSTSLANMQSLARQNEYQKYLMDINYDERGYGNARPAQSIWDIVRSRVEDGLAKFLAVSGSDDSVKAARVLNIPSCSRVDREYLDFLTRFLT